MNATESFQALRKLGLPAFTTAEAAAVLRKSQDATSALLNRLRRSELLVSLRKGLWAFDDASRHRYALLEYVTAPFPSYISLQTAMYLHGMIEQVPALIFAVSLHRTQRVRTAVGTYSIHHVAPALFTGFSTALDGAKVATPEKAFFDFLYFSGTRSRYFAALPELELPVGFKRKAVAEWVAAIAAPQRRMVVAERVRAAYAHVGHSRARSA